MKIRKAIIPAGGVGSRFLPISKAIPKEMMPLLGRPVIQHVVEEAVEAGIEEIIIVTSSSKPAIEEYFKYDPNLETLLRQKNNPDLLLEVERLPRLAQFRYIDQGEPRGLGHAILAAQEITNGEPVAVLLPDDIIAGRKSTIGQMMHLFERFEASIVAVQEVLPNLIHNYGVVKSHSVEEGLDRVTGLVEKPAFSEAPSNLAIIGRYVFTTEIFSVLEHTLPGSGGEIQITDAMSVLLGREQLYAWHFTGTRYDVGNPMGLLKASVSLGLENENLCPEIREWLGQLFDSRQG